MFTYPDIDPILFSIGPLVIRWYGLTYLIAFGGIWLLAKHRTAKSPGVWTDENLSDLVFYGMLGAIVGGRMGSVFFYSFDRFLDNPLWLFSIWEGGMSFHGGFLGVIVAFALYARKINKPAFEVFDFIAPLAPFGIASVRMGNFINGELWGRQTDVPWGMVFPHVGPEPRHASQLYEFALEGVLLFIILWLFSAKPRPRYAVAGIFGIGYGSFRFFVEFFRQPDRDIGFIAFDWLTMGQLLSLPIVVAGVILLAMAYGNPSKNETVTK